MIRDTGPAMIASVCAGLAALLAAAPVLGRSASVERAAPAPRQDTVHVAPPSGERQSDRASILLALQQVQPGGTIQFAAGTYVIGGLDLDVAVPGITLVGHPDGTTIRGCEPEVFEDWEVAGLACNALGLSGGHQTVRGFTFEYAWHGLTVGCCLPTDAEQVRSMEWEAELTRPGGDLIEGNTFRYTPNGLRVMGRSTEPTVVRENRFIDVYHAIGINGGGVHFVDNRIYTDQPHRVPTSTHPGDAINVSPAGGPGDHTSCSDNVVADNRVEGHTHGIRIGVYAPDTSCRRNIIRGNTILVRRVPFVRRWFGIQSSDDADSTVVGVPLGLVNYPMVEPGTYGRAEPGRLPVIEDNFIEGNEILGGHGLGIEVVHASRNQIVHNSIRGIQAREPFPGNVLSEPVLWSEANGSGVWLSAGSTGNEIAGNTFESIAGSAVVVEGDSNRIELQGDTDAVQDLGNANEVVRTGDTLQPIRPADPTGRESSQNSLADTIRTLAVESMMLWNRLEPDAWLALFGDSVRWYYNATSLDRAGVEDMVRGLMSVLRHSRYRVVSEPDVVVLGPDAAVASFAMVQSATANNGGEMEEPTGLTFVYQRRARDWKIVRVHESLEPPSDSLVTATIMARTRELADSWERLDADAYLTHFSDDFTFYFEGSRVSRARFEAVVRESVAPLRESTFEILNPEVEVLGTGAASISFELREVMIDQSGTSTELNGVMTLVYERRGSRWLIVRAHESLLQQRER